MRLSVRILLAVAVSVGSLASGSLKGQSTPAAAPTSAPKDSAASPDTAPAPDKNGASPPSSAVPSSFVIGPEDVLAIHTLHEPDFTGTQEVRPDGMIEIQVIGVVKASGLTPEQLRDELRQKLTTIMRNPEVSVQVVRVNSRKFTIQGEVNHPGTYTFATPVTILDALVNGGGFRDFANTKKIYILRNGKRIPFNYRDVSHGKHMEENIPVENGDEIFVP